MHLNIHFNQWNNACQFEILFEINLSDVIHECRVIKKKTAKKKSCLRLSHNVPLWVCGDFEILNYVWRKGDVFSKMSIDKVIVGHKLGYSPTDFMRGLKSIELFLCIV